MLPTQKLRVSSPLLKPEAANQVTKAREELRDQASCFGRKGAEQILKREGERSCSRRFAQPIED